MEYTKEDLKKYLRGGIHSAICKLLYTKYHIHDNYHMIYYNSNYNIISKIIYNKYRDVLLNDENILDEYIYGRRYRLAHGYYSFDPVHNKIINILCDDDYKTIESMLKIILPINNIITKPAKIKKRKTVDNTSKYWNILEIRIPVLSNINTKDIQDNLSPIIRYLKFYLSEIDRDVFDKWNYLKIDRMTLTKDHILFIQFGFKNDEYLENKE